MNGMVIQYHDGRGGEVREKRTSNPEQYLRFVNAIRNSGCTIRKVTRVPVGDRITMTGPDTMPHPITERRVP